MYFRIKEMTMESEFEKWESMNQEERDKCLKEEVTKENCGDKINFVRWLSGKISKREFAQVVGVSEATIRRLEAHVTVATDEFMSRIAAICVIGISKFGKLKEAEKEKVSEAIGTTGGIIAGVGGALGAVSVAGSVAGLSAAGMTSGLAALGGGAMLTGIGVVAAIPVAAGLAGYGLVRGIKKICEANKMNCVEIDGKWELSNG
jgi:ribosome-binding protein aMBF1 (putative translation factor)